MTDITPAAAAARETARTSTGQFGSQEHTAPEVALAYLADTSDGSDFDIDTFHDDQATHTFDAWAVDHRNVDAQAAGVSTVTAGEWDSPNPEEEAVFESYLEELGDQPQGIDEYFARREPVLVGGGHGAWDDTTPF